MHISRVMGAINRQAGSGNTLQLRACTQLAADIGDSEDSTVYNILSKDFSPFCPTLTMC